MENILIFGGTGFLGFHLCKLFEEKKFKVYSVSLSKPKNTRKIKNVKYLVADISKINQIKKVIKNINFKYVFNAAGYVDHSNKNKVFKSYYLGCKNIIDFFLNKKIEMFIQFGSSMEYGYQKSPQNEKKITKPISYYGKAKLKSTLYCISKYKKNRFPCVVIRLYQVYGPHQDFNRLIPDVIINCLKKCAFRCSEGKQSKDYLYIDDFLNLITKLLNQKKTIGKIFNVGSGKSQNIRKIIKLIVKICSGGIPLYGKLKLRPEEIPILYPDISKIKKITNWKPKINFIEGLKKTVTYYKRYYA